jgi:hypothetical protein
MPEKSLLKFGAIASIVGGVVLQVAGILHPESERIFEPSQHMPDIATSASWLPDHFAFIVAFVFITGGLFTLGRSLDKDPAAGWAKLAFCFSLLAAAFVNVFFTLDGLAFKLLATAYVSAPLSTQPALLEVGRLTGITERMFFGVWTFLAFGVAPLFWGMAILKNATYKTVFGYIPFVSGLVGLIVGVVTVFNDFSMSFLPGFYISVLAFNIWLIIMGVSMWNKA